MTLLEVVFAVALLALVAAAAMSTVTLVVTLSLDDQKILAANEVAHKLILQYLDEKKKMPPTTQPIDYGGGRFTFRYRLEETNMEMRGKARETRGGGADLRTDRFKLITIRVYDGVDTGGMVGQGDELAVMSRMLDPIAITRNPDSMRRGLNTPEGLRELLESFTGGGGGNATPAQPTPSPGRRPTRGATGTTGAQNGGAK